MIVSLCRPFNRATEGMREARLHAPGVAREPASRGLSPASVHLTALAADSHRLGSHGRAQDKGRFTFCRVTQSLAPIQWMAEQVGCDLVQRDSRAAEIAELRQRLQQLERAA